MDTSPDDPEKPGLYTGKYLACVLPVRDEVEAEEQFGSVIAAPRALVPPVTLTQAPRRSQVRDLLMQGQMTPEPVQEFAAMRQWQMTGGMDPDGHSDIHDPPRPNFRVVV
ncbi:MAG: hypothetical protein ACYDEY_09665 [Acidimicrobiales bacterium]